MAHDTFAARLQRAEDLYQQKRYSKTVECLNDLEKEFVDPPLLLYDRRSAAHARLGGYTAALRDGKRMIHMAKTNAKGYLRTGQVLVQMNEPKKALDIYQLGLRHVPHDEGGCEKLREVLHKLGVKLAPQRAADPFAQLPTELVNRIIGYLSFQQMVGICRVSKGWRDFVTMSPSLWRQIDFTSQKKSLSSKGMGNYFKYAEGQTTHLTIRTSVPFKLFNGNLAQHCKNLKHLEINTPHAILADLTGFLRNEPPVKTLILGREVLTTPEEALMMLCSLPLEKAIFSGMNGKDLQPGKELLPTEVMDPIPIEVKEPIATEVMKKLPNLRSLRVLSLTSPQNRNTVMWDLRRICYSLWLPELTRLEHLALEGCIGEFFVDLSPLSELRYCEISRVNHRRLSLPSSVTDLRWNATTYLPLSRLDFENGPPSLKILHLYDQDHLDVSLFRFLKNSQTKVQELLIKPMKLDPLIVQNLLYKGYLDEVRVLKWPECQVHDKELAELASRCTHLHTLDLQSSHGFSGIGMRAIIEKELPLRELDVRNCARLGLDWLPLARDRKVRVRYGEIQAADGGRRVRNG